MLTSSLPITGGVDEMCFDMRFEIVEDSLVESTSQGYWIVEAASGRTGLQAYVDARYPDGRRIEYRSFEEVSDEESLLSHVHAPLIIYHKDWIDLYNSHEHKRGYVAEKPRVEKNYKDGEDYIISRLVLDHPEIVDGVRTRSIAEISLGYKRLFINTPGEHRGRRFDGHQENIRINHYAALPPGMARAGSYAQFLLDSGEELLQFQIPHEFHNNEGGVSMADTTKTERIQRVVLDSINNDFVELEPSNAVRVQRVMDAKDSKIKTLESQVKELEDEKSRLEGQVETLTDSKTALESEVEELKAAPGFDTVLAAYDQAKELLPDDFKISDAKEPADVYRAAVKAHNPDKDLTAYDSKRLEGMVEIMLDSKKDKPAIGTGVPTPGARKVFDQMGRPIQQGQPAQPAQGGTTTQVNDGAPAPVGRARYMQTLNAQTKSFLEAN